MGEREALSRLDRMEKVAGIAMSRWARAAFLQIFLLGCGAPANQADKDPAVRIVSLVRILMHMDRYDGATVATFGFLYAPGKPPREYELSLTRDHAEGQDITSQIAVFIEWVDEPCRSAYVTIQGHYELMANGWAGIRPTRIMKSKSNESCAFRLM